MNRSPMLHRCLVLLYSLALVFLLAVTAHAQPVNIRASDENEFDPEEVSIAVSPVDTNLIAIGANLNYLFTSSDAGGTWQHARMTSKQGVWGDPALAFDGKKLYYVHLAGNMFGDSATWLRTMVVQNSMDLGRTWARDTGLADHFPKQQDKPTLVEAGYARNGTPHKRMLLSWTQFDHYASRGPSDSSHILLTQEIDGVWQDPVRIDDTGGTCIDDDMTNEGAVVAGGKNAEIYAVWCLNGKIYFDRSMDGTLTFGKDKIIAEQPGGWDFAVPGLNRANGFPSIAFDTAIGRLYVQWSDQREGVTNIYMIYSDDQGNSWSPMEKVNPDAQLHHFYSSMAIDRASGHLGIVYYAFTSPTSSDVDVYLARSHDHGLTWTNEKISTRAFSPIATTFFGDYIGITATNGNFYPVWMRMDGGDPMVSAALSVWTAVIHDTLASSAVQQNSASADRLWVTKSGHGSLAFELSAPCNVRIETTDALGRTSETLLSGSYGAGEYQIPVGSEAGVRFVRMTVDRDGMQHSYFTKYVK